MNKPAEAMGPAAEGRQGFKILLVACDRLEGTGRAGAGVLPLHIPAFFPLEPAGKRDTAAGAALQDR